MIQRNFIPGSHWLYVKIYIGNKLSNDILIKVVAPIIRKLQKECILEKWFFVRYYDPDYHLRIRVFLNDIQYVGYVLSLFYKQLYKWNKTRLVWKVQLDTYERELERYGYSLIEEVESIFYFDSECVLSILKKGSTDENYYWMIALKLIDQLLFDFGLTVVEKKELLNRLSLSFKMEFGFNDFNSKVFNIKYRDNRRLIEQIMTNDVNEYEFNSLLRQLRKRSSNLCPIINVVDLRIENKNVLYDLLSSLIHMTMNRVFYSENRVLEMIIYDFLYRFYSGYIARAKFDLNFK